MNIWMQGTNCGCRTIGNHVYRLEHRYHTHGRFITRLGDVAAQYACQRC